MELFYVLLVLLLLTRAAGEVAERLSQPALVGELVAGIVVGVTVARYTDVFPVLSEIADSDVFTAVTDLGIFFLMLLAGLELQPARLAKASGGAIVVALAGFVLPFALGVAVAALFLPRSEAFLTQVLFIGTALAITAVPVTVRVLMDLGLLQTRIGQTITSAAVVDDVASLLLLAVFTGLLRTGEAPSLPELALIGGKAVAFFAIAIAIGRYVFPWLSRAIRRASVDEFAFSWLLLAGLAYAVLAEAMGLHFIVGAFLAGLFFSRRTPDKRTFERVEARVSGVTTGFLAPIFFASIGLHVSFEAIGAAPLFVAALVFVAFAGKVVGCGGAALLAGMNRREAAGVGIGMSARGAIELVIADVALRAGLFAVPSPTPPIVASLFSAVVIMAAVTTLATPMLLRRVAADRRKIEPA